MKKLLIAVLMVLFMAGIAMAIDWVPTDQATVAWDHVTSLENGDPITDLTQRYYIVYIVDYAQTDKEIAKEEQGETDQNQYTVTINRDGRFYVGVECIRKIETSFEKI